MKIAIIGYPDSVKKILKTLEPQYSYIRFLPYEIKQLGESVENLKDLRGRVDGVFSTGIGVHSEIVSKLGLNVPMVYSNREAGSILKALWEVRENYSDLDKMKIGFDIVKKEYLSNIDMYFYAESSFADSFNYMMRSDLDSTAGLNYNVTNIEKSDGSTDLADGSIQVTDPAGTLTIDERTISLVSGHTGREHKTDWYVFEIQVPGFESTTLPLGSYSGSIAVVFESVV